MIRGEVWMAALDPTQGSEQAGTRPVLIIQADPLTSFLRTVVVVPFTSNLRWENFPFCARVMTGDGGLTSDSVALCHQIRVCDKTRLIRRMGALSTAAMQSVEQAVSVTLNQPSP